MYRNYYRALSPCRAPFQIMSPPYQQLSGSHRRTIVVGDIHGCWDEFRRLMELVGFCEGDVLIMVGDFLDRGPGSWEIARFIRDTPNVFSVIGNHERRVAGVIRGTSLPAWSQKQSLSMIPETEHTEWASWLESLPAVIESSHAIVTHARLDPGRPLTEQDTYHTVAVGGPAVTIDLDDDGVPLWFRQMRLDKPVCMGHIGYERVALVPDRLYALDTGAVGGGLLTAVVFPDGDIVQAPVLRNYHNEAREAWRTGQHVAMGDPLTWTLAQALTVLNALSEGQTELSNEVRLLLDHIASLNLEEHGNRIRVQLERQFGCMPAAGPARGTFFKGLRQALPRDWQALANQLLRNQALTFEALASAFPSERVGDVLRMLEAGIPGLKQPSPGHTISAAIPTPLQEN